MKHHDGLVTSATGDFVIERHKHGGSESERIEYGLTFDTERVQIQVDRGWGPDVAEKIFLMSEDVASLVGQTFPIAEIYDAERHWEVYAKREPLVTVEIARDDARRLIAAIREACEQAGIVLSDDLRVAARSHPDSFTLIENGTDKAFLVLWVGTATLRVYPLHPESLDVMETYHTQLQYGSRHKWDTLCELDPRYWLTYPTLPVNRYLTEPMWSLLKKHEAKRLGTEILNGEHTSVVQLRLPAARGTSGRTLKIWISHQKGFRVVKWERRFTERSGEAWSRFKTGERYAEILEFAYREYLPGIWFPEKIERSFAPVLASPPHRLGDPFLKSVLLVKRCELNRDVAEDFLRLDLPAETPAYDALKTAPEKLAALHRVYPRVLERRVAALALNENEALVQAARRDPDLYLLRTQAFEITQNLRHTMFRFNGEYAQFTRDLSAYQPGGAFYELMERNHMAFGRVHKER